MADKFKSVSLRYIIALGKTLPNTTTYIMDPLIFHLFWVYSFINFIVILLSWTFFKNILDEFIQLNFILFGLRKLQLQWHSRHEPCLYVVY